MTDFICSNQLMSFQFYGIVVRFDVILIDQKPSLFVVSKRTCTNQDEETWTFDYRHAAFAKFKEVISHECNFKIDDLLKH